MTGLTQLRVGRVLSIGEAMLELSPRYGDLWRMGVAGDTLNTAWYLRSLLPSDWRVGYLTRLGQDGFCDRIVDFIAGAGIEIDTIQRDPQRSCGLYAISLQNGERSFAYWRSQSAARHLADDGSALNAAIASADVLYLSGITLAILPPDGRANLLEALASRPAGSLLAFDPNIRPLLWSDGREMLDTLSAAAALSDIALPSFADDAANFGDADPQATLARYQALGAQEVVVKNSESRIYAARGTQEFSVDPQRVQPVDTTGAGDSFNAGYLAARLTGHSIEQALHAGAELAGRVVRHAGALVSIA